jgi:hypothetical protein
MGEGRDSVRYVLHLSSQIRRSGMTEPTSRQTTVGDSTSLDDQWFNAIENVTNAAEDEHCSGEDAQRDVLVVQ